MIIKPKRNRKAEKLPFLISIIYSIFIITCPSPSFAEDLTLSLSSTQGERGQTVSLTLTLGYSIDPQVCGFQSDINYAHTVLGNPSSTEGQVLINAEKVISTNRLLTGGLRITASGLNKNTIGVGDAATIYFDIKSDAPLGLTDVTLSNLVVTTCEDLPQSLDVLGNNGSVNVIESTAVPTLSEWGLIIFITLVMGIGVLVLRKRKMV